MLDKQVKHIKGNCRNISAHHSCIPHVYWIPNTGVNVFTAFKPFLIKGILTTILSAIFASSLASLSIPSVSRLTTSALTGPCTMEQISSIVSRNGRPVLAIKDGFVVTPSRMPRLCASRISLTSAVSIKNFLLLPFLSQQLTTNKHEFTLITILH